MQSIINLKKAYMTAWLAINGSFDIRLETESKSYKDLI